MKQWITDGSLGVIQTEVKEEKRVKIIINHYHTHAADRGQYLAVSYMYLEFQKANRMNESAEIFEEMAENVQK